MSSVIRWQPVNDAVSLRDAMGRLFEDSFVRSRGGLAAMGGMDLAVDMFETDNELVVTSALPGVKAEDLQITITGDALCIKAEARSETTADKANWHRQERQYGACVRSLTLPVAVQTEKAEASLKDGVLTLTLPKAEEAKPKSIRVTGQ